MTLISLVSGTYNRLTLLQDMVQSFRDNVQGLNYEIVLVDGGSTDGTIEWCKEQSDIRLIEDGKLLGAISAFTRGAHAAAGKYVLLANDDITFFPNSIMPAIVHLENNMKCGAVAFADNRPMGNWTRDVYKVNAVNGVMNGKRVPLNYAQVGLFRRWLGARCNWWLGEHNEMAGAQIYGGDNSLSAQIWRYGYRVDEVHACRVEDHIANDELRQINYRKGIESNDSRFFFEQYDWSRGGIEVPTDPTLPQQDRRAARILYLPIYEPGWAVQKHPLHGKRGLREALKRATNKHGVPHIVQEVDYLGIPPIELRKQLVDICASFRPDLILTQIQAHKPITAELLQLMKQQSGATVINWNGDQAPGGLYSAEMLPLLHQIDLQLITNMDVVSDYERHNIKWAYWQIGYEEPPGDLEQNVANYFREIGRSNPFDSHPSFPVVYLASLRTTERQAIAQLVRNAGGTVFTPGDEFATLYNFSTSTLAYRRAKIIISDNGFTSRGFVSNRLFQALASGGGVVLQQHVDGLEELTGLQAGIHYGTWYGLADLKEVIEGILNDKYQNVSARGIAANGTAFVRANYSFDAQVAKLMVLIKERFGDSGQLASSVELIYTGKSALGFGLGNAWPSGTRYEYEPGHNLFVHRDDIEQLMKLYPGDWQRAAPE